MAKLTSQQIADKWASNLGSATTQIQQGVMNVTQSPTQKAAANPQKYLQGVTNAVNSGKWANGLNKVSLADWQQSFIQKGLPRISQGAQAAKPKMTTFMDKLLPFQDTLAKQVGAMPKNNIQDSINRASAWITGMSKFQK